MAQCPVCASSIADDFGLIECGECGAHLIVHMDGRVEHSGQGLQEHHSEESRIASLGGEPPPTEDMAAFQDTYREFEPEAERELEKTQFTPSQPVDLVSNEPASGEDLFPESPPSTFESLSEELPAPPSEDPPDSSGEGAEPSDPLAVLDSPLEESPGESYQSSEGAAIDSPDLADVARFGNSPNSGGREGSLRYTLWIEGIDTADVRNAFKEAITDKKLLWDTEKILKSIHKGRVAIENVSSIKAQVVVTRLKHLPIQVKWEQHAIHDS